jgi:hypothetical protein
MPQPRERVLKVHLTGEALLLFERCREKMGGPSMDPILVIKAALAMITDPRLERLAKDFTTDRDGAFMRACKLLAWYVDQRKKGNQVGVMTRETEMFIEAVIDGGEVKRKKSEVRSK